MTLKEEALAKHYEWKGKIEVISRTPIKNREQLSLAYTPGVAEPCLEIAKDPMKVYELTRRQNLVAVITDGTAVLGLGDIGPEAAMPVMEGKCALFKEFAGVDAFPICIDSKDPKVIIDTIALISKSFGGINLEDIAAPRCFEIERRLKEMCDIPVFHDDQHGTAIIVGAAALNGLEIIGKNIADVRLVVNGAGASAIACTNLLRALGFKKENITMCDSKGVIFKGRGDNMDETKQFYAIEDNGWRTLADAVKGADVFLGCSKAGALKPEMVKTMAENPLILALANPVPEITPDEAKAVRPDAIVCTGRSDFPNQVNNVLCFPFLFRGALDVGATAINEEMKLAASHAIASLAKEPVPLEIIANYGALSFGPDYVIPTPFDPRLLFTVSSAVAKKAMETGVATRPINDWAAYEKQLKALVAA
mgnify:CR=1 FL=1